MSVDLKAVFPPSARFRDICDVTAFLLGNEKQFSDIPSTHAAYDLVKVITSEHCAELIQLVVPSPLNHYDRFFYFHWELESSEGYSKGFSMKSRADNIALCRRLVQFFGGELDENDSDGSMIDLRCPPNPLNGVTRGEPWAELQAMKARVEPLTREEIEAAREHAAYDDEGEWSL
jgi:hypothetical protein